MYNSYHRLMTTLKSPYFVFCCNKFIINPDFVVLLQVTILKRSQIANSVGSFMVLDSNYRSMFCALFARVDSFCVRLSFYHSVTVSHFKLCFDVQRSKHSFAADCCDTNLIDDAKMNKNNHCHVRYAIDSCYCSDCTRYIVVM